MKDEDVTKHAIIKDTLAQLGIPKDYRYLLIEYSGSGDSGGIDDYRLLKKDDVEFFEEDLSFDVHTYNNSIKGDVAFNRFEDLIYSELDSLPDWWNNEGGGGTAILDMYDGKIICKHYIRIVDTEDSNHITELFEQMLDKLK
jgi:hypothetical protein